MTQRIPKRMTKSEAAYVRDMARESAFDRLDRGKAKLLSPSQLPEPLKRFLQRERRMVHVQLSAAQKRRLEALSRSTGIPVDKLAQKWVEQGLKRDVG